MAGILFGGVADKPSAVSASVGGPAGSRSSSDIAYNTKNTFSASPSSSIYLSVCLSYYIVYFELAFILNFFKNIIYFLLTFFLAIFALLLMLF